MILDTVAGAADHPLHATRRTALIDRAKAILDDCLDDKTIQHIVQEVQGERKVSTPFRPL
jgi:hypothetical protein